MEVKRDILWRVYLSFLGILLLSVMIMARAFYIQQFEGEYWKNKSDSLHQRFIDLAADRGTIYSEDGSMLSTSIPYFDIYVDFGADGLREKKEKVLLSTSIHCQVHCLPFLKTGQELITSEDCNRPIAKRIGIFC